jgi:hypothetical protein
MIRYDITLLTDSRYVNPEKIDWYIQNILDEDHLITTALEKRGLKVHRTNWDDVHFNWKETRFAIFRTTWDYFHRFQEFSSWLKKTSEQTQFINPLPTIYWNMDKHYLQDLKQEGINIPETIFIEAGSEKTLEELVNQSKWEQFILKPAISGAARHTYRFNSQETIEHEKIFRNLIAEESLLLQKFQKQIITKGEVAFMLFDGKYSHSVLKKVKEGDFRVQDDFGGTLHEYSPSQDEIQFIERVVSVCRPVPVYARVDVMWNNENELCVSELELIEPELWIRKHPVAAELFASALEKFMSELK